MIIKTIVVTARIKQAMSCEIRQALT